jgi:2-polyprenyl-3-methyl-5-hydroxy-6-metoxy-1,4-benzoquinol methylase
MKPEVAQKLLAKVKSDYELIARRFSETRQTLWEEMKDFKKYVKDGGKVLDIGCGNGRLYEVFKGMSIDYTGIDNSEEMIKIAKEKWGEDEKRRFQVGDLLDLPTDKRYNAIFMIAVLHHVPSDKLRRKVLENVAQILEKDGFLIMTNWDLYQAKYLPHVLKNIFLKIFGQSNLDFGDALIPWRDPKTGQILAQRYCHAFILRELDDLIKKVGLKLVENFYVIKGEKAHWWNGWNIVTVAKKE